MTEILPQPSLMFSLGAFILMIAVLVVVHEGGHFLAGRFFNTKIDAFAFGFGRELLGHTDRRGVRWRLNLLPLGGYVKFTGDLNEASQVDPSLLKLPHAERDKLFAFKPLWQRAIIVAAGPAINFAFAILILAGFYVTLGHPTTPPVVSAVMPESAAASAGLQAGDRILSIDGESVSRFEDVINIVMSGTGKPLQLVVSRDAGSERNLVIQPQMVETTDRFGNVIKHPRLGIARGQQIVEQVGPITALGHGVVDTGNIIVTIGRTLRQVVMGERNLDDLGGPIRSGQVTGQQAAMGVTSFIAFMAFFSVNLGFINLLPIPTLDGGHLLLYAVEAVRRRPLGERFQQWAFMSGFAAIMTLMVVLTWNDLSSVGVFKQLSGVLG
ncbi:zinc metalloprotease [Polymorphobacter multimanifer]|uniref:Zinc metalloprotease n=1 Tax=Polymorphobacter multimanifer TaxID=1070431 RepID=A0A841L0N1_9SPHN|nr:RIP metalloprotease RseP [Polymorphobacter multimanifer]MBB6225896.1 regulator of sigma E protease [Polymorphobacter multimanifer]GGI74417.1 zinc metalloprotease [Polymorphobacter multimanifer]